VSYVSKRGRYYVIENLGYSFTHLSYRNMSKGKFLQICEHLLFHEIVGGVVLQIDDSYLFNHIITKSDNKHYFTDLKLNKHIPDLHRSWQKLKDKVELFIQEMKLDKLFIVHFDKYLKIRDNIIDGSLVNTLLKDVNPSLIRELQHLLDNNVFAQTEVLLERLKRYNHIVEYNKLFDIVKDDPNYKVIESIRKEDYKTVKNLLGLVTKDEALEQALIFSAKHNDANTVIYLLKRGVDVHARNDEALLKSAEKGYSDIVQVLLKAGANVHAVYSESGNTVLMKSAENGHINVVKLLIQYGVNIHEEMYDTFTDTKYKEGALRYSVDNGHVEVAKLLIDAGANIKDPIVATHCIQISLENIHLEKYSSSLLPGIDGPINKESGFDMIKMLIENGVYIDNESRSSIESTSYTYKTTEMLEYVINMWGLNDIKQGFVDSAEQGNMEIVKYLLKNYFDDVKDEKDNALRRATQNEKLEMIKYLVEQGANVQVIEADDVIDITDNLDILQFLVDQGIKVDISKDDVKLLEKFPNSKDFILQHGKNFLIKTTHKMKRRL
jgi:ankyrin repeat protein